MVGFHLPFLASGLLLLCLAHPASSILKSPLIDTDYYARTVVRHEHDWDWGRTWSGWSVNNQPISTLLSTVLGSYRFTLPRIFIQRGLSYTGASTRLRRVVRQLMTQPTPKPMKIGIIGGSISWGQAIRPRGEADWFSLLSKWLLTAFPSANITTRNGCTPALPASYMILCLELSVDPDVDLVFMEFTVNNGFEDRVHNNQVVRDMERLVRRVLALPGRPAVVLMHAPTVGMANYPHGHPKNPNNMTYTTFYATSEDVLGALTQYYDVQSLSLRSAVYDLAVRYQKDGFLWEHMFVDAHPGNQGHKVMADLAVYLLQQTALGLLQLPYGPEDAEVAEAPLPAPIYAGNVPPNATMCLLGNNFRALVLEDQSSGFAYVNEGTDEKPKPGYVAREPGSRLRVRLSTDRSELGPPTDKVHVFFHYLRSYEHMGVAKFSCISGCECQPMVIDGHHTEPVSQLYLFHLIATQSSQCLIEAEVLQQTSSKEHKFKVAGLVISERPGGSGIMDYLVQAGGSTFGVREHNGDVMQITHSREGRRGGGDALARRRRRRRGLLAEDAVPHIGTAAAVVIEEDEQRGSTRR